ncbi:MoxR family ATPase [Bacillus sp. FJAT-49736]|uniref:ATP-binding protein n=1 Tax=Bacillus sp. FJAT-49736 TaxID=2833582 RepID=UPI001BC9ABDD|nr:MoxR family ATPase [Bacillus sp. FJAT-49736]MBS4173121.1 MoxR family ATPase [Bacillus sp. FJAT-49736]
MDQIIHQLPNDISEILKLRKQHFATEHGMIGEGGYIPADNSILLDTIIAISLGKNVLLKGPTGSGKTKLAETISSIFGQPMQSINCSVDLDAEGLLGFKTIHHDGEKSFIDFVPGPVIKAMTQGQLLYIDEINMAKPETLPILNGVLDYRRMLHNPFTGDTVKASRHFGVIAAINEGYIGTVPLNEALKNRFVIIDVPYIQADTLKMVLQTQSKLTNTAIIDQFVSLSSDLIAQAKMGQISEDAASIRALIDTCDLSVYMPPMRAIQRGIIDKLEDEREKAAIRNIAETIFG